MLSRIIFFTLLISFLSPASFANNPPPYSIRSSSRPGFIENRGQVCDQYGNRRTDLKYLFCGDGIKVQLKENSFSYEVLGDASCASRSDLNPESSQESEYRTTFNRVDVELVGANPFPLAEAFDASPYYYNYVTPGSPLEGYTGIREYSAVIYRQIYPNIDMLFETESGSNGSPGVKYSFIVYPGGNPSIIRLRYTGAGSPSLENGRLMIATSLGTIHEAPPYAFTTASKGFTEAGTLSGKNVECSYILNGNDLRFQVQDYPRDEVLVIDPTVAWCTYFGGYEVDWGYGVCVYPSGNIAITGRTISAQGIATMGAFDGTYSGDDGYIALFSKDGALLWGTYFGGSAVETSRDVEIDKSGNIVIAGLTGSDGLGTPGVYQRNRKGTWDAFVAKFTSAGARIWSTYYGGDSIEWVHYALAVNASNDIIIAGSTKSINNIATASAPQTVYGGNEDGYVAVFDSSGSLHWATYIGGNQTDHVIDVTSDPQNNVLITGWTESASGVSTSGAQQQAFGGEQDGFLAKYSPAGALLWSTYIGSNSPDQASGITLAGDNILVTGYTESDNGIATAGAYQAFYSGLRDAFLAEYNTMGSRLWSTYFGGGSEDRGNAIFSVGENIFFTGITHSQSGISTGGAIQPLYSDSGDVFFTIFDQNGQLKYGSYFGDTLEDIGYDIAFDPASNIVIVGESRSGSLATPGSYQSVLRGKIDTFILKIAVQTTPPLMIEAGPDQLLCNQHSVQLDVNVTGGVSPYRYKWTPSKGLSSDTIRNPMASPSSVTEYTVQVRDANDSVATDVVRVNVIPPIMIYGPREYRVCKGGNVRFGLIWSNIVEPSTIQWTPSGSLDLATTLTPVASPYESTDYILRVSDGRGCVAYDTVHVIVLQPPAIDAGADIVTCPDIDVQLTGSIQGNTPPYTITWSSPDGIVPTPGVLNPVVRPAGISRYILKVSDINGCLASDTMVVFPTSVPDTFSLVVGSVAGHPGDTVVVRTVLQGRPEYSRLDSAEYSAQLTFSRSVLVPLNSPFQDFDGKRHIRVTGMKLGSDSTLFEIPARLLLGEFDESTITLSEFGWKDDGCLHSRINEGKVRIGICEEGGKRLLFTNPTYIVTGNYPNPFSERTVISYTIIQPAHVRITVTDISGGIIETIVDSYHNKGDYTAVYHPRPGTSGALFYTIETPEFTIAKPLRLLK